VPHPAPFPSLLTPPPPLATMYELSNLDRPHVTEAAFDGRVLSLHIAGGGPSTRIHVVAREFEDGGGFVSTPSVKSDPLVFPLGGALNVYYDTSFLGNVIICYYLIPLSFNYFSYFFSAPFFSRVRKKSLRILSSLK
jgi:hypothetical protein